MQPPKGDVDDRIRFIAQQLGLATVMWGFDSFDWKNGQLNVTPETVQANYDALITQADQGAFDTVGAIILTHELNNYTMQTAIDNYPKLAQAFDVCFIAFLFPVSGSLTRATASRPHIGRAE
jgi:peptidoglycan/xylan/chitin deacetylase (PgdA/CDA1 family)